jgi:SAM-dependent methyltransferase
MVGLAKDRLEAFGDRARVVLADGAVRFPLPEHSVDRVVCSYVLDLLSEADIGRFLSEAHRVLMPGGRLCIASLTRGVGLPSRIVASVWMSVFRLRPALVGGCRPILVRGFVDPENWRIVHRRVLTPYGVPSEVLVLETKGMPDDGCCPPAA